MQEFTLDYFIDYFNTIPTQHFTISTDKACMDAYEWLTNEEQDALFKIVKPWGILTEVNDGEPGYEVFGNTIKERILGFLEHIKKNKLQYLY